ncbi:MAG TPA: SH3 domain-containing protein [Bacilli bacterium]|nr:SH3 domain-containing protein [Bacilli bacterium]
MKKITSLFLVLTLLFSMFFNIAPVNASVTAKVMANNLNFRSGPSTETTAITTIPYGTIINILDTVPVSGLGCTAGWLRASYNNVAGYVCAKYISYYTVTELATERDPENDYEILWQSLGFPSSYWEGLTALKVAHPNYEFEAVDTGLDWSTAVREESVLGTSLIQVVDLESDKVAYISTAGGSYDYVNNEYIVKEGSTWYAADSEVVAYYMDPRNFLTETRVFMFEDLLYTGDYLTIDAINKVFTNFPNLSPYAADFLQAGIDSGINPVYIATLVRQEIGSGTAAVSGAEFTYPEENFMYPEERGNTYSGYYNFFNYGAGTDVKPIYNALIYAKNSDWNTPLIAITAGSNIIGQYYIKSGQNTSYFKKFNVQPGATSSTYSHQYMTNIQAPYSEASTSYASYESVGLLAADSTTTFKFLIPVYSDMPVSTSLPTEVHFIQDYGNTTVDDLLTNTTIKNSGEFLSGFSFGTKAEDLIAEVNAVSSLAVVTVTDINGNLKTTGSLVTGDRVDITFDEESQEYTVILYGDSSGDGQVTIMDLLKIQKHIIGSATLIDPYLTAADTDQDGVINIVDLLREQKHILGQVKISG